MVLLKVHVKKVFSADCNDLLIFFTISVCGYLLCNIAAVVKPEILNLLNNSNTLQFSPIWFIAMPSIHFYFAGISWLSLLPEYRSSCPCIQAGQLYLCRCHGDRLLGQTDQPACNRGSWHTPVQWPSFLLRLNLPPPLLPPPLGALLPLETSPSAANLLNGRVLETSQGFLPGDASSGAAPFIQEKESWSTALRSLKKGLGSRWETQGTPAGLWGLGHQPLLWHLLQDLWVPELWKAAQPSELGARRVSSGCSGHLWESRVRAEGSSWGLNDGAHSCTPRGGRGRPCLPLQGADHEVREAERGDGEGMAVGLQGTLGSALTAGVKGRVATSGGTTGGGGRQRSGRQRACGGRTHRGPAALSS